MQFFSLALQQALESKLAEVDSSGKSQVSELMGTLKNVKEKLKEKEVFRKKIVEHACTGGVIVKYEWTKYIC